MAGPYGVLEKANMLMLTKEATQEAKSLKTQLLFSTSSKNKKLRGEHIWKGNAYFSDEKVDINIRKKFQKIC